MARQIDGAPLARCALLAVALFALISDTGRSQTTPATPGSIPAIAQELPWPRTVHSGTTTLTLYQPQLDAWDGFALLARSAVKVEVGRSSPRTMYGTVTIDARTLTDKSTRVVVIDRATVTHAKFPSASSADTKQWSDAIVRDLTNAAHFIALDRLESALASADIALAVSGAPLDTTPPHIVFSSVPAILVYVDGDPVYKPVANTRLERVINTRPLVLRGASGVHYLKIFDGWMESSSLDGAWRIASNPPPDLAVALAVAQQSRFVDELTGRVIPSDPAPSLAGRVPVIYVATRPTELIVTDGIANFTPVRGVNVFYMLNTTGRVLKSGQDFKTYVLTAGRWFRASSLRGPWTYVAANALPSDFSKIPDSSPIENVKASIAGTRQARDAAIAASIAQTTAVRIFGLHLAPPHVDGEPAFKVIEGTHLEYVVNTAAPIVRVSGSTMYSLENGVWFTASSVTGPWSVATSVPIEIYSIPPKSPLYYVTFARIYAASGDTMFVGYTPGYQGTYVDGATGVVVYGTGYAYQPWSGTQWYGAPVTYGFGGNLAFTPWTGWAVALGLGWGWTGDVVVGSWGMGAYPWWGPWGWGWSYGPTSYPWKPEWGGAVDRGGEVIAWRPGGWTAYAGDYYRRWGDRAAVARLDGWTRHSWVRTVGLSYNSHTGIATSGQRGAIENVLDVGLATRTRDVGVDTDGRLVAAGGILAGRNGDRITYIRGTGEPIREVASVNAERREAAGSVTISSDDFFAGQDGNIYRRSRDRWQRRVGDVWQAASPEQSAQLRREGAMRDAGEQRAFNLRQSSLVGMQRPLETGDGIRRR